MLGDEVACAGVEGTREEGAKKKVEEWVEGAVADLCEYVVEGELDEEVYEVNYCEGRTVDKHGADSIEEDLEGAEEGLAKERVEYEGFEGCREIGVEASDAEGFVVGEMVGLLHMISFLFYCESKEFGICIP